MGERPQIEYVRASYNHGTTAVKETPKKRPPLPSLPRLDLNKPRRIYVDPVASIGSAISVVILVLLIFGAFHLKATRSEYDAVSAALADLKRENAALSHQYHTSYDLEEIRQSAEKIGMIDASEAERFTVTFSVPEQRHEMTAWENMVWFLSGLFEQPVR